MVNISPYTKSGESWRTELVRKKALLEAERLATLKRVHESTAKARLSKIKLIKSTPPSGVTRMRKSSWVKTFSYDSYNKILYMSVYKSNTIYKWENIDADTAKECIYGLASCTTDDLRLKKRWWIGKNPSLGAAYWHILVSKYGRTV